MMNKRESRYEKYNNKEIIKGIRNSDELYDIMILGHGLDEEGKKVSSLEEHEYILGYPYEE